MLRKHHYDENLKIVSDWKFFVQVFVLDQCTYRNIDTIISVQEPVGASMCAKLIKEEREYVLHEFFPEYIIQAIRRSMIDKTIKI